MTTLERVMHPDAFKAVISPLGKHLYYESTRKILELYTVGYGARNPMPQIEELDRISDGHCRLNMEALNVGDNAIARSQCAGESGVDCHARARIQTRP